MSCEKVTVELTTNIRLARAEDLDDLEVLDHKVFGDMLAYPPFVLRQFFDVYSTCWLVAENPDGGLAGYSLAAPAADWQRAWLLGLAVDPEFRNLGIGERLTLRSLELLRSFKIPAVYLTVEPANDAAIALYRKIGFVVAELGRDYFGPGEDRVIMAHRFTRSGGIPSPRPVS